MTPYFRLMRVHHWTKNLLVLAGLLFSARFLDFHDLRLALLAFASFCFASSAVYCGNDVLDAEADRAHPVKRTRPVAAGLVTRSGAAIFSVSLAFIAVGLAWTVTTGFLIALSGYLVLQVCYSVFLKHHVIVDVIVLSLGFVIRAAAGALAIQVRISPWLLFCTFLLALFLAFGKRRHEFVLFEEGADRSDGDARDASPRGRAAESHRAVLGDYNRQTLDMMIGIVTSAALIAYSLYCLSTDTVAKFGDDRMLLTVPVVLYGLFRYLILIYRRGLGGNPEKILVSDRPILVTIVVWGAMIVGMFLI